MAPRALAALCALAAAALAGPTSRAATVASLSTEDTSTLNSIETHTDYTEEADAGACPAVVARAEWGAAPARLVERQAGAAPFVVVHHTYVPGACNSSARCAAAMRAMQRFHQDERGWNDIGYRVSLAVTPEPLPRRLWFGRKVPLGSTKPRDRLLRIQRLPRRSGARATARARCSFALGGDGRVYEGRGWGVVGAHAPRYNHRSVGISFIGDYVAAAPPAFMTALAQRLIACGVRRGELLADYRLLGHRQVRDTQCPGEAFYRQLRRWPHWVPSPDADLPSSPSPSPSSPAAP